MKLVLAVLILILLVATVEAPPPPPPPPPSPPSGSPDFHYLVLQWPPTFCSVNPTTCNKNAVNEDFTIHGLWPQKNNQARYVQCSKTPTFQTQMLNATVLQGAKSLWPSLSTKTTDGQFWGYEWQIHGTCSGLVVPDYFWTAVERARDHNITQILKSQGIVPNAQRAYRLTLIEQALNGGATKNLNPRLQCLQGQLHEISFCVNKQGSQLQACTPTAAKCPANVRLPQK